MHLRTDTGSANQHFAKAPSIQAPRSKFMIAEKHVTTIGFDFLYPIWHKFIYPGDTMSITQQIAARLTTQVTYLYDDLYFDVHAWFVPFRLIQDNWARFQFNAQPGGPTQDNSALTTPKVDFDSLTYGEYIFKSLYDYFGYFPTAESTAGTSWTWVGKNQHHNNYLPRAYNLIYNENYRDENICEDVVVDKDDGPDNPLQYVLLKRGKRHDKFTSMLPWPQKGDDVGVSVAMSGSLNVTRDSSAAAWKLYEENSQTNADDGALSYSSSKIKDSLGHGVSLDPNGGLSVDISAGLASFLIDDLRYSVSVKHLLEADARGGTRDVESIQNRWNVTVPDFRLAKPEYLGGSTFLFDGHIVPQTSESGTTPQANLAAFSQSRGQLSVNHSFVEHGVMIILISARSNITYQFGMQKELQYQTRYDFVQPEFVNLGEVAVPLKELYCKGDDSVVDEPVGYQEYGYEMRYGENRVSAEMRSNYPQSRDNKHMADDYGAGVPALNETWIGSNTDISRNIAVDATTADPIELNTLVRGSMARVIPMYSIPGLQRL